MPREKVWITTKIWRDDYEKIQEACDESLQRLKTDYLDLLLLHWPTNRLEEHRRIFEQLLVLQQMGKVKKI
ncbi:MAG: aldo/keto reductase [Patescibacteria group bacterium]|nr:aldo/keto reductase [Patescibacteria group bacterium]